MAISNFGSFFILLCLFVFGHALPPLPKDEVEALGEVMSKLEILPSPVITPSYCERNGYRGNGIYVYCNCSIHYDNGKACHIVHIEVAETGSGGVIDPRISVLKYLSSLNLGNIQLFGQIPDTIGDLQHLQALNLYKNSFTGSIPSSLGKLSNLISLKLERNMLSGLIPRTLGNLTNLIRMRLQHNHLTGRIPSELGRLWMLEELGLHENQLVGVLPVEFGNLTNLLRLDASANYLTGSIPPSYDGFTVMSYFGVAGNYLTGAIPKYIANWTNISTLFLSGNEFQGELFPEIFGMSKLEYLWISDLTNSSASFPSSGNLTNINNLVLRNCSIIGPIPNYIANWSSLKYLDLSFNKLTGEVPNSLQNLAIIDLSYNNVTYSKDFLAGGLQYTKKLLNVSAMRNLGDENCGLKSKHDSLFINCGGPEIEVEGIQYEEDKSWARSFLSKNKNWGYSCSGEFLISANNLSPINYATDILSSDVATLQHTSRFCAISLTYYAFCLHQGDYLVELLFAGTDTTSLWKRVFDVYIQGERVLKDFEIKRMGDFQIQRFFTTVKERTLEIRLYWAGKGSLYSPVGANGPIISAITMTPRNRSKKLSSWQISLVALASVLIPLIVFAFLWKLCWLKNKELDEFKLTEVQGKNVTLRHVIDATQNFSAKTQFKHGRFGQAYKAEVKDPPIILAVEKLSTHLEPREKIEIQKEISQLTFCKHENVVQLYNCYSKGRLHLLIYEYMEKGSLSDVLFNDERRALSWKVRLDICLGIAKGLLYLHEGHRVKIVHGNLSDRSIMLDKNYTAKLAEFGLASIYDDRPFLTLDNQRRQFLATMAPECAYNPMSIEADVYSFGHVLLEMISGQPSVIYQHGEIRILSDKAVILERNGMLRDLLDEKVSWSIDDEEQAKNITMLALKCLSVAPTNRPPMSEIVCQLEDIIQMGNKKAKPGSSS